MSLLSEWNNYDGKDANTIPSSASGHIPAGGYRVSEDEDDEVLTYRIIDIILVSS